MKAVHGPNRCARHVQKDARKKDRCKKTTRDTRPIMLKWLRLTWLVCSHKLVFSVFSSPFSFFLLPRFHLLYVLDCRPDDSCSPASISFNLSPNIALCARRVGHLFSFVSQYSFVCSMPWPMISQSTSMSFLLSFCQTGLAVRGSYSKKKGRTAVLAFPFICLLVFLCVLDDFHLFGVSSAS